MSWLKRVGLLLFLILIILGGGYFWRLKSVPITTEGEVEKLASKSLGRHLKDGPERYSDGVYSGEYFSLEYPTTAKPFESTKLSDMNPEVVEYFSFDGFSPRVVFSATVIEPNDQKLTNLDEVSGVMMRRNDEEKYSVEEISMDGNRGEVFTKSTEGFEKTAFIVREGRLYTFSMTAQSGSTRAEEGFDEIIRSVKLN
jgi:hypothetical protein